MSIAQIQATARRALHDHMARDASYYQADGTLVGLFHIRIVENPVKTGDLAGTNLSYAEVQEVLLLLFPRSAFNISYSVQVGTL